MKKFFSIAGLFFVLVFAMNAQEIPAGIKMGMSYSQIKPIMKNGEWQAPQENIYIFFSNNPVGMYSFLIDPKIGLVGFEINMIGKTLNDIVSRLTQFYGSPVSSSGTYIWGIEGNLPDNILGISAGINTEAAAFVMIRIMFNNSLSLLER
ncbi:MAG: hypothetical protein FWF38_04530 [Spirochaetaceae bacterium]|nr:hypothetical protein [Spirochaetaceae bacterium]